MIAKKQVGLPYLRRHISLKPRGISDNAPLTIQTTIYPANPTGRGIALERNRSTKYERKHNACSCGDCCIQAPKA